MNKDTKMILSLALGLCMLFAAFVIVSDSDDIEADSTIRNCATAEDILNVISNDKDVTDDLTVRLTADIFIDMGSFAKSNSAYFFFSGMKASSITIDGNGHVVTATAGPVFPTYSGDSVFTFSWKNMMGDDCCNDYRVKDLMVVYSGPTTANLPNLHGIGINGNGNVVTLQNVEVDGFKIGIRITEGATANLSGCTTMDNHETGVSVGVYSQDSYTDTLNLMDSAAKNKLNEICPIWAETNNAVVKTNDGAFVGTTATLAVTATYPATVTQTYTPDGNRLQKAAPKSRVW